MKNKKMLKVLSTSFILGTILMTNPTGAEKAEDLSLSEKLVDNQDLTNSVTSETKETKVVSDDSETTEEKTPELTNDGDSKENSEKLELSSDVEKEAVRANENRESELILPEAKFDKDMSIDDPATYDYTGYFIKHYNPTNEKFMKERNSSIALIGDTLIDNTDKKNEKTIYQSVAIEKGKDLSSKIDEYIAELEKNKGNNKVSLEDIQTKVFGVNGGDYYYNVYGSYFNAYLSYLYDLYNSTYVGGGNGHKLITDGKLLASDFSIENFKEIHKNEYSENVRNNSVVFAINDSFRNKPIVYMNHICLSEDQYFKCRDEILNFIKSETGFKNLTSRKIGIGSFDDKLVLPTNVKNALSEEYVEENMSSSFGIHYDTENINTTYDSFSKADLKKSFAEDFSTDKDTVNNESFTLRIGFNLSDNNKNQNDLPKTYYLSRNNKPIFKGDGKLAFKQKSDIVGSEYYISNTVTDKDDYIQRYTEFILKYAKDDENFNKLTKKEQVEYIQSQIQENLPYIDEIHKDDSANIKKYQDFLNSKKWGNQRLTQYVGNVDTKIEEKDFKVVKKEDPTLAVGESKVAKKGVKGKKVTKITYKVDRTSGELTDPVSEIVEDTKPIDEVVLVGTKKVVPAKPIEDIAKTTKTTKETIKAKVSYEADDTLEFEKQNVVKKAINGEKEIITVSQKGKKDVVTEKVIKEAVNGVTKLGNKKIEVETKDGVTTTTTTIYEVEKETGKLVNPKVTTHKTTKIGTLEDIATTTKTTKEVIKAKVEYEADDTLEFEKQNVVTKPVDGEKETTTESQSGKKDVVTEKVIKNKVDGVTKVGNKKVEVETKDGITTTTTTIYEVDKETGKLVNPKVTTHKTTKIGTLEDIATTTKITKEVIKAEISYEADETLEFEKQNVVTKPINGEKEITTVSQSGKKDVVTAKVIKDKVDGVTKVGNKKVEVETKDGVTTTITTIYEVEKGTGKLVNPKVTTHKTTKAGIIEDIAKKTIPATKIEDIAKKTIPATKIEDIAKKTIPATKIEDIAKKTIPATKIEDIAKKTMPATKIEDIAKNTNKNDEKDNSNEPKKDSHLPKAGVNSEILTLAVGALATIGGINLSKKRRK